MTNSKHKPFDYKQEHLDFIRDNCKGVRTDDLTKMFNEKFGTDITVYMVQRIKKKNKWTSGLDFKFKKGHVPDNKGKKGVWHPGAEKTWFKKGHVPINHREVGSVRTSKDGYVEIKVAEPNKWQLMARYVWQKYNGPIPKNYVVYHLNKDKTDDRIENLVLIHRSILSGVNQIKLSCEDPEITKTAINIVKLNRKLGEIKNKQSSHEDLCVMCGLIIPEGGQVCINCRKGVNEHI